MTNFDTKPKNAYAIPAESTTSVDELPQRTDSNAARRAKLFGYANAAPIPAPAGAVSKAVEAARAKPQPVENVGPVIVKPPPRLGEFRPVQKGRKDSKLDDEFQTPPNPIDSSMQAKADTVQAQSEQPKRKMVRVAKPSISSLDDIMSMLENETFAASPASLPTETTKKHMRGSKKAPAGKSSLSSLDDMMRSLEDIMVSPDQARSVPPFEKMETVRDSIEEVVTTRKPSFDHLDDKMSSPGQNWGVSSWHRKASSSVGSVGQPIQRFAEPTRKVGGIRLDTTITPSSQPNLYYASPVSFTPSESKPFATVLEEETESTGKPLTEYMKEAEEMRIEREQMELVRRRILEEEVAFQREADKFAEEEEQMRKFVENFKLEEERDVENQGRKQRIAEEKRRKEEERRRKEDEELIRKEEEERKRLQELEDERLAVETAERLNMENERMETERREREARAFKQRADMERANYMEEEARLKTQRMEDDRRFREEEQASRDQERAAKENAERLRIEKEEAERTSRRREDERFAQEQRRAERERAQQLKFEEEQAERLRIQKEEAQRTSRRREDERFAQEQRRAERQRASQFKG